MYVATEKQELVLNLRDPSQILNIIPTARPMQYRGQRLVTVPHRLEETKVLNNLGILAPSPIRYYYSWPGKYKPFYVQKATAEQLTLNPRMFVLNEMGVGKTLSALWAADFLMSEGLEESALIVSPLSTLERVWADEIMFNLPHRTCTVLHGTRDKRRMLLAEKHDFYIINHDGVKTIQADLLKRKDIGLVIIDEVPAYRNSSTDRFKSMLGICAGKQRVWALTGTPIPNSPTDAWAQCRLVLPGNVPRFFSQFRDMTMKQVSMYSWVPKEDALSIVYSAMSPSVRYTRDECMDLPECMYSTREVTMSPAQHKAYKTMYDTLHLDFLHKQITASNEGIKAQKLLQIACGIAYDNDHEKVTIDVMPRINVVKEIIEEATAKVIVFAPFVSVLGALKSELKKFFEVETISGAVSKNERDDIFHRFQKTSGLRVLVAHPGTMSHGLTLTAANVIVWFAPVYSNEIYEQSNARIVRPGQKNRQFIIHLEGSAIERQIYARLKNKRKMQGTLLEMFKNE